MDQNEEFQEEGFDLESILNEFRDPAQEPPKALEDDAPPAQESPAAEESAPVEPVPPENLAAPPAPVPDLEETLLHIPSPAAGETPAAVPAGDTIRFDPIPASSPAQQPSEAPKAEPAFETEETFIPAPAVFTPKSRLRELKKKLVSGPEKRYYALSEHGVGKLQLAIFVNLVIVVLCGGAAAMFSLGALPESRLKLVIFSQVLSTLLSGLLGCQLMLDAIGDLFTKGRFSVNTLLVVTFGVCVADGVLCLQEGRIPCCAAFSLEMTMALWARYERRSTELSELDTMRKAVRLHGLVKTGDFYQGKPGLQQVEGEVEDFMDTYQEPSAPERLQNTYALMALLASIGIAVVAYLGHGASLCLQALSTSLLAAVPATFFIAIDRPKAVLEQRLHMVGTVLCGWKGVKALSGKAVYPISDRDLFPQGSTKLNGVKFYSGQDPDTVVSLTTSLLTTAGGTLLPVFQQLLKNRGGSLHSVQDFREYEEGGIGGVVCGHAVLLGSQSFLQTMGVEIPEGTMVSQAVYAALDGRLAAVYAISYAKMRSAAAGLVTLCGYRRLTPVVLCTDFVLTESFIREKFDLKSRRIAFPSQEERTEMLKKQPEADAQVLALVTREELISAAYAVTGSRALRTSTNLGMAIHLIGGIVGLLTMLVLTILGSTELLTPINVLLYQLIWSVPGLLVTEWTRTV